MTFTTADIFDVYQGKIQSCATQFKNYGRTKRFFGPVRTLRCECDNALFKELLSTPGEGSVLVVDGAGSLEAALLGDMNAAMGMNNGWAGCIINGAVRDVAVLRTLDIGIKAIGSNPAKSSKEGTGGVDLLVSFGGTKFEPGQWVYCDEDGLALSPEKLDLSTLAQS